MYCQNQSSKFHYISKLVHFDPRIHDAPASPTPSGPAEIFLLLVGTFSTGPVPACYTAVGSSCLSATRITQLGRTELLRASKLGRARNWTREYWGAGVREWDGGADEEN